MVGVVVVFLLGTFVWGVSVADLGGFLAILVTGWLSLAGLGFLIGTNVRNQKQLNSLSSTLSFVLFMVPPIYYPLSRLPHSLQYVALLVPSTHAAEGLRAVTVGRPYFDHLAVLVVTCLLGFVVATRFGKWEKT